MYVVKTMKMVLKFDPAKSFGSQENIVKFLSFVHN